MGRLKSMPSRLSVAPPLLPCTPAEQDRTRARDQSQPWRAWYKTARWQKLRLAVLTRDNYICRATGAVLVGVHPAPNSPVVDHMRPHRGDPERFWDQGNLQTVSKEYHDKVKQSLEKRGRAW